MNSSNRLVSFIIERQESPFRELNTNVHGMHVRFLLASVTNVELSALLFWSKRTLKTLIGYGECNPVWQICSTQVIQTGEKSQERQEWRKETKRER